MDRDLEKLLESKKDKQFKSEGERRIAYFLENNDIKYRYESGVLINSHDNKQRIWYPDFYLPEFKTYIEYYGLAGQRDYDRGIQVKENTYRSMKLDVVPVYPWMFSEDWQGYIMGEVKRSYLRQYKNLMAKPYWSKHKHRGYSNSIGYGQTKKSHY